MASCTAIEECESSFASPCPQVGCLHASTTTEYDKREQRGTLYTSPSTKEHSDPTALLSDPAADLKPYQVPDPVSRCPPAASLSATHPKDSAGSSWEQEPEKYVMMKCYNPGYDSDSNFKVSVSETTVLITDLRPSEQNAAYEAILSRAPAHLIPEYYTLHLSRLDDLREAIADATARTEHRRARIKECSSESLKNDQVEREQAQEAFRAYKMDVKAREKLKAYERGVMRLLERCEGMLEGKPDFEPVIWRRSA